MFKLVAVAVAVVTEMEDGSLYSVTLQGRASHNTTYTSLRTFLPFRPRVESRASLNAYWTGGHVSTMSPSLSTFKRYVFKTAA